MCRDFLPLTQALASESPSDRAAFLLPSSDIPRAEADTVTPRQGSKQTRAHSHCRWEWEEASNAASTRHGHERILIDDEVQAEINMDIERLVRRPFLHAGSEITHEGKRKM